MSAHTPGPWFAHKEDRLPFVILAEATEGVGFEDERGHSHIATIEAQAAATEANARLIVAAPLMLEALENIENDDQHMPSTAWELIQAAIAEARGPR